MEPAELDRVLSMVRRWHDRRPARRRMLKAEEVRALRVLGPVQIRLRSLVEERHHELVPGPPPKEDTATSEPPDVWAARLEELDLETMVADAETGRTRATVVGTVVRECGGCAGSGHRTCERCGGDGILDLEGCLECEGEGKRLCFDCAGAGKRTATVRLLRSFRFEEATRIHEDDDSEVGPHVLLHLVDHPTPGELFHEQDAPRIRRYAGKGSAGGYRTAATPVAATVEKLLKDAGDTGRDRVVHQWLTVTRIPVYALELSRGRVAYVYGDPPEVSPPELLRPAWLVLVPLLAAMATLGAIAFAFFWLVARAEGR